MSKHDSTIPTMRMCRFVEMTEPPCCGPSRWLLETEGKQFVVCDSHLAEGIRKSGLPAYISASKNDDVTVRTSLVTETSGI